MKAKTKATHPTATPQRRPTPHVAPQPQHAPLAASGTATTQPAADRAATGSSSVAPTLLLTLAILFLVLAALPWRKVFPYQHDANQVLRCRVAFVVISLSVGFGYLIATVMNGAI